jgi:CRISPR-associated protein Cas1
MKDFYILKPGKLRRKHNTLYFIYKENDQIYKKSLPINFINSIFIFNECNFNTKFFNFIARLGIPIHFFNYYGFYSGSFLPKKNNLSGFLLVKQVSSYLDLDKRLYLAKEFVRGAIHNSIKNLLYYQKYGKNLKDAILKMQNLTRKLEECQSIQEVMAIEGNCKFIYYQTFEEILGEEYKLEKRIKKPPDNAINALISFGNSLLYTTSLNQIYKTQLDPTISFLHEPGEMRFSLSLDLAEVFKPVIVDKVIFKLVNNRMIDDSDFIKELNHASLNEKGKRVFITAYEKRLNQTVFYKKLKRYVSYKHLIKLECYKLIKHLVGDGVYKSFKMNW